MKYFLYMGLLLSCSVGAFAQRSGLTISYPIAFPMGNLHDYISKTSFRGINFEFEKQIKPQVVAGIETGWNVFYESVDTKEYTEGTATITGKQYRYTNSVPILAEAKYFPNSAGKKAAPYVGFGIGTLYSNRSTDFGLYRITTEAWQFCLRPEAGFSFKTQSGINPFVGVKYYWAFNNSDLDAQPFLSINIGARFTWF
ncbi:MAG: outer membrane beta-barrel protein [Chitinophagaceae bacterium]